MRGIELRRAASNDIVPVKEAVAPKSQHVSRPASVGYVCVVEGRCAEKRVIGAPQGATRPQASLGRQFAENAGGPAKCPDATGWIWTLVVSHTRKVRQHDAEVNEVHGSVPVEIAL